MDGRIRKTIAEHLLLSPDDHLLVAVSGGPDSVALLHWLHAHQDALKVRLSCAHFNHGLRGEESDEDERYVARLSNMLNIPFYSAKVNLKKELEQGGAGLQELARDYRYRFLEERAKHIAANKIALAHHQDDQVETILMRFLRGTGSTGMIGMPYRRRLTEHIWVIRPFLDIPKEEILQYVKLHQLDVRIDSSNLKTDYTRNRIRIELIPELEKFNPNLRSSIISLSRMIKEDEVYLQEEAEDLFNRIVQIKNEHEVRFPLSSWLEIPLSLQRRIIKLICNYLLKNEEEVSYLHIEAIRSLFSQDAPKHWDLPSGVRVTARYGEAIFARKRVEEKQQGFLYTFSPPASIWIPECNLRFNCSVTTERDQEEDSAIAYFDYDRISHQLMLRSRREGDRIELLRLGGHKKVKDIFIDAKIPKETRDRIPLFFAGDQLLWIPGIRKSALGAYDHKTRRFLRCQIEKIENGAEE